MKYKIIFSYFGHDFYGYQIQEGVRTVQEEVEKILHYLFQENIRIYSSGRTDKGVHALNQVATFTSTNDIEPNKLKYALNRLLPKDIHIKKCEYCSEEFHARFSAIKKRYVYKMIAGEQDPLLNPFYFITHWKLDENKIRMAMNEFIGEHDFKNFCTNKDELSYIETIESFTLEKKDNVYIFSIVGSGFKRYMVRMIIGTVLAVGRGSYSIEQLKSKIDSIQRENVSFKVPPEGLYLDKVFYEGDE